MKLSQSRRGFLLAVVAGTCLFPSISHAANIVVGTGNDTSYLVLQSTNLGVRTYEIHYTYSSGTSQDGYFLLGQVLAGDSSIAVSLSDYGTPSSPNYIVDSFTFNSVTETGVFAPPYVPYWSHWVSGGEAGYPTASPIASGSWDYGSGISAPYRLIAPGSWDGLFYSDGSTAPSVAPSVAPIPETSSALLAVLGSVVLFKRRRNS